MYQPAIACFSRCSRARHLSSSCDQRSALRSAHRFARQVDYQHLRNLECSTIDRSMELNELESRGTPGRVRAPALFQASWGVALG